MDVEARQATIQQRPDDEDDLTDGPQQADVAKSEKQPAAVTGQCSVEDQSTRETGTTDTECRTPVVVFGNFPGEAEAEQDQAVVDRDAQP